MSDELDATGARGSVTLDVYSAIDVQSINCFVQSVGFVSMILRAFKVWALCSLLVIADRACFAQAGLGQDEESKVVLRCDDEVSPAEPLWHRANNVARAYRTKENIELSNWSLSVERLLTESLGKIESGGLNIKKARAFFLLNSNGVVQDLLVSPSGDYQTQNLLRKTILNVGSLPMPPIFLNDRRLEVVLDYPSLTLNIDFHQPNQDRQYFERMKVKAQK